MRIIENYTPEPSFIEISSRESPRFHADRTAKLKAAHPELTEVQIEKLLTRAWLEVSMQYDKHYLRYVDYLEAMERWVTIFTRSSLSDLLDVIALFDEVQTMRK